MIIRKVVDRNWTIWGTLRRKKRVVMTFLAMTVIYITFFHSGGTDNFDNVNNIIAGRKLQDRTLNWSWARTARNGGGGGGGNGGGGREKKGKNKCTHTPYVLIDDIVVTMPPVPPINELEEPPSYIQLCREFINRSEVGVNEAGQGGNDGNNGGGGMRGVFRVIEDENICTDWEAPHYNILSIYASSLIAAVGKGLGLRYKHNCRRNIPTMHNDPNRHYDYTSVQALLPENLIASSDAEKVTPEIVTELCNTCIWNYENVDQLQYKSGVTHHCILMPDEANARSIIEKNMELPMVSILPSLIDRLRHMAEDWIVTTGHPDGEAESGVIIAVDEMSSIMSLDVYEQIIPTTVTSIQIFASASCGIAHVQGSSSCIEHGRMLKRHFLQSRSQYGTYVRYDVVGSSAASFSRMIEARITICPPGTVMCLLPALGKRASKKAYIAESPTDEVTFAWFEEHVLEERKRVGFQEVGFDAVPDSDYLDIISDVDTMRPEEMENIPLPVEEEEEVDADTGDNRPVGEYNYQQWAVDGRSGHSLSDMPPPEVPNEEAIDALPEQPQVPDDPGAKEAPPEKPPTPPEQPQVPDDPGAKEAPPEKILKNPTEEVIETPTEVPQAPDGALSENAMEAPPEKPTEDLPEEEIEMAGETLPEGEMEAPPLEPFEIPPEALTEVSLDEPQATGEQLPEDSIGSPPQQPYELLPDSAEIAVAMEAPPEKPSENPEEPVPEQ